MVTACGWLAGAISALRIPAAAVAAEQVATHMVVAVGNMADEEEGAEAVMVARAASEGSN
jgi:hypothetical protein